MSKKLNDEVRPVTADGIQEFDNELPRWWVNLFYLTIVFGIAYGLHHYVLGGETLIEAYNAELITREKKVAATNAQAETEMTGSLEDRIKDPAYLVEGKKIYTINCVPCHGPDGRGVVGPNLTDNYFLHGNKPEDVVQVIAKGVIAKGMVPWEPVLGRLKVEQVSAFVMSLVGTTPVSPKDPQGKLME